MMLRKWAAPAWEVPLRRLSAFAVCAFHRSVWPGGPWHIVIPVPNWFEPARTNAAPNPNDPAHVKATAPKKRRTSPVYGSAALGLLLGEEVTPMCGDYEEQSA